MKRFALLLALLALSCSPTEVYYDYTEPVSNWSGTWTLGASSRKSDSVFIGTGSLTLHRDSTFDASFSIFFYNDSSRSTESVHGTWSVAQEWYTTRWFVRMTLSVGPAQKSWLMDGDKKNQWMSWYAYDPNPRYSWVFVSE